MKNTILTLNIGTDRLEQTVLLLKVASDQGLVTRFAIHPALF